MRRWPVQSRTGSSRNRTDSPAGQTDAGAVDPRPIQKGEDGPLRGPGSHRIRTDSHKTVHGGTRPIPPSWLQPTRRVKGRRLTQHEGPTCRGEVRKHPQSNGRTIEGPDKPEGSRGGGLKADGSPDHIHAREVSPRSSPRGVRGPKYGMPRHTNPLRPLSHLGCLVLQYIGFRIFSLEQTGFCVMVFPIPFWGGSRQNFHSSFEEEA